MATTSYSEVDNKYTPKLTPWEIKVQEQVDQMEKERLAQQLKRAKQQIREDDAKLRQYEDLQSLAATWPINTRGKTMVSSRCQLDKLLSFTYYYPTDDDGESRWDTKRYCSATVDDLRKLGFNVWVDQAWYLKLFPAGLSVCFQKTKEC